VVFPVKYRKTLLDEEVVQIITETALETGDRHDMEFERMGGDGNPVHWLCSARPKRVPGQRVRVFKRHGAGAISA
jgi:putative transposase